MAVRQLRTLLIGIAGRNPMVRRLLWQLARLAQGRHFVGTVAVVLDDAGRVPITEHLVRTPAQELPHGWVKRQEHPALAVEREVHEETGLRTRAVDVVGCEDHSAGGARRSTGITIAFVCERLDGLTTPGVRSVELRAVRWLPTTQVDAVLTSFEAEVVATAVRRGGLAQVVTPA